jgi:hypothetical protein
MMPFNYLVLFYVFVLGVSEFTISVHHFGGYQVFPIGIVGSPFFWLALAFCLSFFFGFGDSF